MRFFPLVWAGLWRRPVRTILTLLSVVTAFFLFGVLQGINVGINSVFELMNEARLRVTSRVNLNAPLPIAHVARIASVDGVQAVTPITVLVGTWQQPTNVIPALGVDIEAIRTVWTELELGAEHAEAMQRTRTGAVVGAALAEKHGWKVGDRIPLSSFNLTQTDGSKDWAFDIVGIYDIEDGHDWATQMFVNYDYLDQARAGGQGTTNQIILSIDDPERSAEVARAIDEVFANSPDQTRTQNEKAFLQSALAQVGDIGFVVNAIVGAVLFTLLFLTANTMMQSVRERIPELAVLKTLGFSDTGVLSLVLTEALLLSVLAALLGLAAAAGIIPGALSRLSTDLGGLRMPADVFIWGAVAAIVLALMSGLPPALRAGRLKIVDALAGR